jgi:uncharacterized damage-inducible protein DinB
MNANAFRHFYDDHLTENRKIWDCYIALPTYEQLIKDVGFSHGSVREQIIHLMSVDEVWFSETQDVEPSEPLPSANFDDSRA